MILELSEQQLDAAMHNIPTLDRAKTQSASVSLDFVVLLKSGRVPAAFESESVSANYLPTER